MTNISHHIIQRLKGKQGRLGIESEERDLTDLFGWESVLLKMPSGAVAVSSLHFPKFQIRCNLHAPWSYSIHLNEVFMYVDGQYSISWITYYWTCSIKSKLVHIGSNSTWINLLKIIYDRYTIFVFHFKITLGVDSLLAVIWSKYTAMPIDMVIIWKCCYEDDNQSKTSEELSYEFNIQEILFVNTSQITLCCNNDEIN